MSENIELNGKTYLPASQAARKIGVTRDYVGRLCREGKVIGRRVGSTWYVEAGSLDELLVSQQYVKAKRAQELSGKRVVEYRAHQADALAPEVSQENVANPPVRTPDAVVPLVVSEAVANVPHHILETQQNVAESLRAAGRRVGASPSARAFLEHAPRAVYPTVHAVAQYSNLAHRLFALAFAFAFTFGAYGFVDAQYRTVAIDAAQQGMFALSEMPFEAQHIAIESMHTARDTARDLFALRPSRDEMLASAVSVATLTNTGVQYLQDIWNRAVADTASLTRSLIALLPKRDPNSDASVFAEIVASKPKIAALTEQRSGATTVINHPVVERIREIERTVQTTVGGISAQALADSLQQLDNKLSSEIAFVSASGNATYQVVAQTNRIDQLSGTDLTNITVHGVSGLVAGDIPALSYFAATSTISIAYGGTGTSTIPTYGKMLIGNSLGGYDLIASSTLGGSSSQWTTSGSDIYYTTGNIGIGSTTPIYKLSVEGISSLGNQALAGYFTATSSSISSFAGGLTAYASTTIGAGTQITGLTISGGATTTGNAYIAGKLGIGTADITAKLRVVASDVITSDNNTSGLDVLAENNTGDRAMTIGVTGYAYNAATSTTLLGGYFGAEAAGTTTDAHGLMVDNYIDSGFVSNFYGVQIISNKTGGVVNNRYGIYLSAPQGSAVFRDYGIFQEGTQNNYFAGNIGIGTTSPYAKLSVAGQVVADYFTATSSTSSVFPFASSTALSVSGTGYFGTASTSNLTISNVTSGLLKTSSIGVVSAAIDGVDYITGSGLASAYPFQVAGNATSTLTQFNGGLTAYASSTIGSGIQAGGLTISGGATTTGNAYIAGTVGIGTTTPLGKLSIYTTNSAGSYSPLATIGAFGTATTTFTFDDGGYFNTISDTWSGIGNYVSNASNVSAEHSLYASRGAVGAPSATQSGDTLGTFGFGGYGTSAWKQSASISAIASGIFTNTSVPTDIVFNTAPSGSATLAERLRITSAGNVGIGTTSPWGLLSVNPNGISGPSFVVGSSTATNFIVTNAGNIGIGSTSPAQLLSVAGNTYVRGGLGIGAVNTEAGTLYASGIATSSFDGNVLIGTALAGDSIATYPLTVSGFLSGDQKTLLYLNNNSSASGATADIDFSPSSSGAVRARIGATRTAGGGNTDLTFWTSTTGSITEKMRLTDVGNLGIGTTTPWGRFSVDTTSLAAGVPEFTVGSSTRQDFVITQAGYVGIGTSTPATNLHLYDATAGFVGLRLEGSGNYAGADFGLYASSLGSPSANDFFGVYNHSATDGATAGYKLTVNKSGNVGIGTTSAMTLLTVVSADTTGSTYDTIFLGQDSAGNGNAIRLRVADSSSGNSIADIGADFTKSLGWNTNLTFSTRASGGSLTEQMRVTSTGNVGIGTTTPWAQFSINPTSVNGTAPSFVIGSSTATKFIVDNAGNVGIGTTSPAQLLHLSSSNTNATAIRLDNTDTGGRNYSLNSSGSTNTAGAGNFSIYDSTAAATRLLINSSGNVGIGTTTPTSPLHVVAGSNTGIYLDSYSAATAQGGALFFRQARGSASAPTATQSGDRLLNVGGRGYSATDFSGSTSVSIRAFAAENFSDTNQGAYMSFYTTPIGSAAVANGFERLRITDAGNVGIGTTTPGTLLTISGAAALIEFYNTSNAQRWEAGSSGSANFFVYDATNNLIPFAIEPSTPANTLYIDSTGNIGLGDTTPTEATLVIGSAAAGSIALTLSTTGTTNNAVCWDNAGATLLYDCDSTPADYAESYSTVSDVSFGDIVMTTGELVPQTDGVTGPKLGKATHGGTIIGIVSDNYHDFTSAGKDLIDPQYHPLPVALNGRVPVTVNLEGGPIAVGDAITLSSIPGVGTKATTTSQTIGIALEPLTSTGGAATAHILVFVKPELTFAGESLETFVALNELGTSAISTTSSQGFVDQFFANVFARVTTWLADATNGVGNVFAQAFHATQEICVDDQCLTKDDVHALLQLAHGQVAAAGANNPSTGSGQAATTTDPTTDTTPPTITLTGASSITISIGDTYSDLGATVTDNVNNNLGYTVSIDGATSTTPDQLSLDTTTAGTHTILFSATDQAGNTGTATRTVIVGDSEDTNPAPATTTPPVSDTTTTSIDPTPVVDTSSTTTPSTQ